MKQLAPGVFIVGRYEPQQLDGSLIGRELVTLTSDLKTQGYGSWTGGDWQDHQAAAEVRPPDVTQMILDRPEYISDWHRDNSGKPGGVVVWSNREQTEIKLKDGTVLCPDSCDVLLISNAEVEHRTPQKISKDRWFFRRHVELPDWPGL